MPLIPLGKSISKQHMLPKDWKGWHRCGTCQINSDNEVNNDIMRFNVQDEVNAIGIACRSVSGIM